LIKMIILEENFKWHLEAFASELFKYIYENADRHVQQCNESTGKEHKESKSAKYVLV